MYTEKEITQAIELFTDFNAEIIADNALTAYANRTTDRYGNIISFYIGLEDEHENAVTGYDDHHEAGQDFISRKRAHLIPLRKTMGEAEFEEYASEWRRANR